MRAAYDAAVRGFLVGLLFVTACYGPSVVTGVACAPNGSCPAGQMCNDARVCVLVGAPGDAAVDGNGMTADDPDGDKVPNGTDNCPDLANAEQGDEDGDRVGDACDLCPQLAATTADGDGDKIGDTCDPNPGTRDTRWLFEDFRDAPGWPGSNGWKITSDAIRVTAAGEPAVNDEYLVLPLNTTGRTYDNYSTTIAITVEQLASAGDLDIGIEYIDSMNDRAISCELTAFNGTRVLWLSDDLSLDQHADYAWTTNASHVLRLVRHGTSYSCEVSGPAGAKTVPGTSSVAPSKGDDTNIWAYGMTAQFTSVVVIGPEP